MKLNIFLALLLSTLFIAVGCDQSQKATTKKSGPIKIVSVPQFNEDSAFAYVAKQVSFGPRVPGSEAHKACADWLTQKLTEFTDTVYLQPFKARTYDKVTRNGLNIIGSFNPEAKKRVLLMAHWDSRPYADADPDESNHKTPIDAANDGASGVGVLLEMARQMKLQNPGLGVDIVLFDLEDWGPPRQLNIYDESYWGIGSQYWSKNPHLYGYQAKYGILLDMVGAKNPSFFIEYHSKRYARYVVDLVWNTAADLGYDEFFIDEDGIGATDDHYFVNKYAKIPSIDIIHQDVNSSNRSFFEHWHTTADNLDAIDPASLKMVGQVVLTVVYNE
jgi:Zn-dependent M28 family amino/carboxypeptidase